MKKIYTIILALTLLIIFGSLSFVDNTITGDTLSAVSVKGYYRKNGTYVQPHQRSSPDGNPYNNYSYPGNYNPNTGNITGGNPSTYLNNYYNNSSSGYSDSTYFPPYITNTPSCPIMSTYDSTSNSCMCMYGYVVDSSGSCTSGNIVCHQKYGYGSSYNYYDKTCSCDSGYRFDSTGQCVSQQSYCTSTFGFGAQYSSLKNSCVCSSGYVVSPATNRDAIYFIVFRCVPCKKLVLKTFKFEQNRYDQDQNLESKGWVSKFPADNMVFINKYEESVPEGVLSDFKEGVADLQNKCLKSAVSMFRRSLQFAMIDLGADNKKELIQQIDNLDMLTKDIKDWAHNIRIFGNWGSHPQDDNLKDIDQKIAIETQSFLEEFFNYVYVMPARVLKSRKKNQKKDNGEIEK